MQSSNAHDQGSNAPVYVDLPKHSLDQRPIALTRLGDQRANPGQTLTYDHYFFFLPFGISYII